VGEYFDIAITEKISSKEAIQRMNAVGAVGMEILSFKEIPSEKKHSGMTILAGASYLVTFERNRGEAIQEALESFMMQSEINILKETKRSVDMVNIKPYIYKLNVRCDSRDEVVDIEMTLAAGSKVNVKPNLVMKAFCSFLGKGYEELSYQYQRLEMYANSGDDNNVMLVSLESLGKDI
jgi:radical SAM-linked protein